MNKKKTFGSKVLSGLLVLGMVFSACPIIAIAEEVDDTSATVIVAEDETVVSISRYFLSILFM